MTAIAARAYAPGVAYRFSRGGVEFSGKGPEEFAGVVRARFTLSAEGRKIADAVKTALNASVVLYDDEKHEHQVARADDRWLSIQTAATDEPRFCYGDVEDQRSLDPLRLLAAPASSRRAIARGLGGAEARATRARQDCRRTGRSAVRRRRQLGRFSRGRHPGLVGAQGAQLEAHTRQRASRSSSFTLTVSPACLPMPRAASR